jgi:hypothetical protein
MLKSSTLSTPFLEVIIDAQTVQHLPPVSVLFIFTSFISLRSEPQL